MSRPRGTEIALATPLFHISHLVDSYDIALDCYRRIFGCPIVHGGYWELAGRWAMYVYVGDVWIWIGVPAADSSTLNAFLGKFGNHLHSLGWYVQDIDYLEEELSSRGLRVGGRVDPTIRYDRNSVSPSPLRQRVERHGPIPLPPGCRYSYEREWKSAVIYTNFRDALGMLEFCEVTAPHPFPPRQPDPDMLSSGNPLGIERSSHYTTVVRNAFEATSFWVEVFGARVLRVAENELLGTQSSWLLVGDGNGTLLELAEPIRDGPARADLEAGGLPILHAVSFRVRDLNRVTEHLQAVGAEIECENASEIVVAPTSTAGARFSFTTLDRWS